MAIQNKEARFLQERRDFERHFPHAIGRWDDRLNNGHGGYSGIFDAYWMGWAVCVAWRDGKKSRSQPNG